MRIKIANEAPDVSPHRLVTGVSGREYLFMVDKALQAYVYTPKADPQNPGNEDFECQDIFNLMAQPFEVWRYVPVLDGSAPGAAPSPFHVQPWLTPDKYAEHTLPELIALCRDCGFVPQKPDDEGAVRAQLAAYYLGRAIGERVFSVGADATPPTPAPLPLAEPEKKSGKKPKADPEAVKQADPATLRQAEALEL